MARYDGMDMIIERLQLRLAPEDRAPERVRTQPSAQKHLLTDEPRFYESAVERLVHLQREAEQLAHLLSTGALQTMTSREHDRVLALMRMLVQELTQAHDSLQVATPHE